jgi:hypothetical protein
MRSEKFDDDNDVDDNNNNNNNNNSNSDHQTQKWQRTKCKNIILNQLEQVCIK